MNIESILASKGRRCGRSGARRPSREAMRLMRQERMSALVVSEDGATIDGIVSDRGVMQLDGRAGHRRAGPHDRRAHDPRGVHLLARRQRGCDHGGDDRPPHPPHPGGRRRTAGCAASSASATWSSITWTRSSARPPSCASTSAPRGERRLLSNPLGVSVAAQAPPIMPRSAASSPASCWRCSWVRSTRPSSPPPCRRSAATCGDLDDLPWVVTAYLLSSTAVTPLYGKLSDIHGRRAHDAGQHRAVRAGLGRLRAGAHRCSR